LGKRLDQDELEELETLLEEKNFEKMMNFYKKVDI
jgi:hypothetical protein